MIWYVVNVRMELVNLFRVLLALMMSPGNGDFSQWMDIPIL